MSSAPRRLPSFGLALALALAGCSTEAPQLYAEPWPEANQLFLNDATWIGGDGAYSVDLGDDRVLWLFGDSFIATSPARRRAESWMVRNSVALQTGYDPTRAFMRFYYGHTERHPSSFVPENEDGSWLWPAHGIRVENRLLLFYARLYQERPGMWGFETGSYTAFTVDDPGSEPSEWKLTEARVAPEGSEVQLGGAVIREGDYLYVYGIEGDSHSVYLCRFDLDAALSGDLTAPLFWSGDGYGPPDQRDALIDIGAPEFSVHYSAPLGAYVFTETAGFGATTLAIRTAPRLEGPFSDPTDMIRPPESFGPEPFVYAGKAHPELRGADLAATYVPSHFEDGPPDPEEEFYYPRFVRVSYP
jgi:hypothetical protein